MNLSEFGDRLNRYKYLDAKIALRVEKLDKAARLFGNHYSKAVNRNDAELAKVYGNLLPRLERLEEACEVFDSALKLDPTSAFFAFRSGFVQERMGNLEAALARYDLAISLDHASA
ncbi:hypothetical protein CO267_18240, partial [Acinetobacter baumannii]|uniref:hypothetical protein n=1 Tax=Acinetobacter baumannii TaxID=470 RepID=UPI000BD82033